MIFTEKEKQTIKIARYISKFDGGMFECGELTYIVVMLLEKELSKKALKHIYVSNDAGCFPIKITVKKSIERINL